MIYDARRKRYVSLETEKCVRELCSVKQKIHGEMNREAIKNIWNPIDENGYKYIISTQFHVINMINKHIVEVISNDRY